MNIKDTISFFKSDFQKYWKEEKYKWIAVKHFQDAWDIDAADFAGTVEDAFSLAKNLLQGGMYYAYSMLCMLTKADPEKMRSLFRILYDEEKPLAERIRFFREGCDEILSYLQETSPDPGKLRSHYQALRSICVYLAFRYPDEYFLYKSRMYQYYKDLVGFQETSNEKDPDAHKYDNFSSLCRSVLKEIEADKELLLMYKEHLEKDPSCYSDPAYHLLTQTVIYVGNYITTGTVPDSPMADNDISTTRYWIYSPGDNASIWDECYKGGFMAIGWDKIGDLTAYSSKDEMKQAMKEKINPDYTWMNAAHATWQFANEMKPGDIIFAKKGLYSLVGRGVVTSGYRFDPTRKNYKNVRSVNWTHRGEWPHPGRAVLKSLTDITPYTDYVEELNALFVSETEDDPETHEIQYPSYDPEDFLEDVYMDEESYDTLVSLVRNKKNVILQGAPGVGKTYAAKRLAYSMMGVKDPNRVMMIQFHQSYSYEDFIMGFRPTEKGFELKKGAFYNFCKTAKIDSDNEYFFIIDEINRGNLSKIFGELFMLIENDKRGVELQLLYSDEKFSVPENVYIIGMMNTADRSLALLDYALRRRFSFFEMKPGFNTDGFRKYQNNLDNSAFNRLISVIETLNNNISSDDSLGEGFCIGHSYFCNLQKATPQALSNIVEYEIIPLLKEYWFDEPTKVKEWANTLRSAIK